MMKMSFFVHVLYLALTMVYSLICLSCAVLNSQTWENILNHILPVAKEELHASFYGNILKNFSRGLKVGVSGKGDHCEVTVAHGLVCRRTGAWYSVDRPGVELATQLATHIAAVQPGVSGQKPFLTCTQCFGSVFVESGCSQKSETGSGFKLFLNTACN